MAKKTISRRGKTILQKNHGDLNLTVQKLQDLESSKRIAKLSTYKAVLETYGHQSIEELGKLEIGKSKSHETVLQTAGVVLPNSNELVGVQLDVGAFNFDVFRGRSKKARITAPTFSIIQNTDLPQSQNRSSSQNIIPLNIAYWFANDIIIGNNTDILIDASVNMLVIISNTLTVGTNVNITWQRSILSAPKDANDRSSMPNFPTASSVVSENGRHGKAGVLGAIGETGASAPKVETWFMTLNGQFPRIDLAGQEGQKAGKGGTGQTGQNGQNGCPTELRRGFCSQQKGPGGHGGNGGSGGSGGPGGNGGNGGRLKIYTTTQNILSMNQSGFTSNFQPGEGGEGGDGGQGGNGGQGGKKGVHRHKRCSSNQRSDGRRGYKGKTGPKGINGKDGDSQANALKLEAITQSEFNIALTKPAIVSTNKQGLFCYVGDTVTVYGLRFSNTDKVFIQDSEEQLTIPCTTTFVANNLITFIVPKTIGGYTMFEVRQVDGTKSANQGTLLIRPKIDTILPTTRMKPGTEVFLKGSGFDLNGSIKINDEDTGTYSWVDYETIKYKVHRPSNVVRNILGENVSIKVINSEGASSNNFNHSEAFNATLDTYRILVVGDSSAWEAGIMEYDKAYSHVKRHVELESNIGVYVTVKAHIGAIIGRGDSYSIPEMHGEMAVAYPTVHQQVDGVVQNQNGSDFDLIIIAGGANDVPVTDYLLSQRATATTKAQFKNEIVKNCYRDLKDLLLKMKSNFPKAKILVRGYYNIFSHQSSASGGTLLSINLSIKANDWKFNNVADKFRQLGSLSAAELDRLANERALLNDIWISEGTASIEKAVGELNTESTDDPRTFFINSETKPEHAAHAPNSLLWEPQRDNLVLKATDPMLSQRKTIISTQYPNKIKKPNGDTIYSPFFSERNSSYHPNNNGALRYFNKMKTVLDNFLKTEKIVLKSTSGQYIYMDGSKKLRVSTSEIAPQSILEMVFISNNKVAFKNVQGEYVCAEQAGGVDVNVNRKKLLAWETFELQDLGNSLSAIVTSNGHFLSLDPSGVIHANATSITDSEKFMIV